LTEQIHLSGLVVSGAEINISRTFDVQFRFAYYVQKLVEIISGLYEDYLRNDLDKSPQGIEKYSRKNLTAELAAILNKIII